MEQAFGTYNFFYIEICLKQFNVKVIEIDVKILFHFPALAVVILGKAIIY